MGILNAEENGLIDPKEKSKPTSKVDYAQPDASGKSKSALMGSDYNVAPLPTTDKSNSRGYRPSPKLAPMDQGRKKESFGPGSDFKSY